MAYAWGVCESANPGELVWGETGPALMARAVARQGLEAYKKRADVFCPVPYHEWRSLIEPTNGGVLSEATQAVHLWNEMWRREGLDKNGRYDADSLYERLRKEYSVS